MKYFFLIFFSFILNTSFSQKDKEKILSHFDYVDYYPDSTIRSAHKFTGISLERFTVEFNEIGMPVAMGNYKKGAKIGIWSYSDGSSDNFDEAFAKIYSPFGKTDRVKSSGTLHPGCGTGKFNASMEFKLKYNRLLDPEGKEIKRK